MVVSIRKSISIVRMPKLKDKNSTFVKDVTKRHSTLKEFHESRYPFPYSYLLGMLHDFLKKGIIKL